MLYIGFSNYSKKIHARLFCSKYKHCAPIIINDNTVIIYQFVHINKIVKIFIQKKDLKILRRHGWKIVKYSSNPKQFSDLFCFTCVQFTKKVCGIKNISIQTPLALFNYLNKQ